MAADPVPEARLKAPQTVQASPPGRVILTCQPGAESAGLLSTIAPRLHETSFTRIRSRTCFINRACLLAWLY